MNSVSMHSIRFTCAIHNPNHKSLELRLIRYIDDSVESREKVNKCLWNFQAKLNWPLMYCHVISLLLLQTVPHVSDKE